MKYLSVLFVLTLSFIQPAFACQFNTDCGVGSQCLKEGFAINGVCVGGLSPGNSNDRKPVYDSLDLNRGFGKNYSDGDARKKRDSNGTYGDTCSFDTQCGVGSQCMKSGGSTSGICM